MVSPFRIKESDYKSAIPSDIKVISVFLRGDAIEICALTLCQIFRPFAYIMISLK